jgi:biopolymer transport protein ExbD
MAANVSFGDDDGGGALTDINVTPLVDVVLVLLIVFMITVPTVIGSAPIKVNLPLTEAAMDTTAEQLPLNISLKREGGEVALYYNTNKVSEGEFRQRLKNLGATADQQVSIAADRDIAYNDVVHVMDLLADVGIHKIWLPTKHVAVSH